MVRVTRRCTSYGCGEGALVQTHGLRLVEKIRAGLSSLPSWYVLESGLAFWCLVRNWETEVAEFAPNSATSDLCSLPSFGAELLTARMVQDGVYVECAVGGGHLQSRHSLTDVCSLSSMVSMSRSTRSVPYQSS